ncbi:MAG TPA: polysaccharide deacetylase family protein [Marmoricola sp.]|nr:polysaccharide deacetylase family protein [Marmoricola sp.]
MGPGRRILVGATGAVVLALAGCGGPTSGPATGELRAATGASPTCSVPQRLRGVEVEQLPVGADKVVALTFDAGANADAVDPVLSTLADRRAPGTFFLTGAFVQAFPKKAARIGAHHVIGNHTDTHPDLTTRTDRQVRRQVRTAETKILAATGQDPRRFFRFPYGARTPHLVALLNQLCYVPFRWTVDTLGWKGTSGGQSVDSVVARVVAGEQPGEVVLMHVGSNPDDGSTLDADALPRIIHRLRADGYRLVRLSRVLAAAP